MNFHVDYEMGIRLLLSFGIGTAIGLEREYRSKVAGLRTMIMICLGSTIFTELSLLIGGDSPDRIASTIVTGIGFLGAGVIFKDGLSVTGITTATTIWICAALGMAVGVGEYFIALVGSVVVLIVLIVFEKLQFFIDRVHQSRTYKISYLGGSSDDFAIQLQTEIKKLKLKFRKKRDLKENTYAVLIWEVYGKEKYLDEFNAYLKLSDHVKSYEY